MYVIVFPFQSAAYLPGLSLFLVVSMLQHCLAFFEKSIIGYRVICLSVIRKLQSSVKRLSLQEHKKKTKKPNVVLDQHSQRLQPDERTREEKKSVRQGHMMFHSLSPRWYKKNCYEQNTHWKHAKFELLNLHLACTKLIKLHK